MPCDALRKYFADIGLTDVVKPGDWQYTLKHGKVLVEAISAEIETLEFRRMVEREMRFNVVVHDPDALFNIIDQQRRDQAVIEANDAARRQTATRRDARSVAAAGTKLQGNVADKHDGRSQAMGLPPKPAGQGGERRSWPEPRPGPQAATAAAAAIYKQSRSAYPEKSHRDGPASATSTAGASGYKTTSKRWLRGPNLLRLRRLRRRMMTTWTFACRGRRWRR